MTDRRLMDLALTRAAEQGNGSAASVLLYRGASSRVQACAESASDSARSNGHAELAHCIDVHERLLVLMGQNLRRMAAYSPPSFWKQNQQGIHYVAKDDDQQKSYRREKATLGDILRASVYVQRREQDAMQRMMGQT